MKNLRFLFILAIFASLANSCSKDTDITLTNNPPPIIEPISLQTTMDVDINNGNEILSFHFDECAFDDFEQQRATNSFGTLNDKNTKGLITRLYNRDEMDQVETELILGLHFINQMSEGPIDATVIGNILSEHPNAISSTSFGLEIGIRKEGAIYSNLQSSFSQLEGNRIYDYALGFNFEIKDYEVNHQSECSDENFLRIKTNFDGKLYHHEMGEKVDSLNILIEDLEMLLIID